MDEEYQAPALDGSASGASAPPPPPPPDEAPPPPLPAARRFVTNLSPYASASSQAAPTKPARPSSGNFGNGGGETMYRPPSLLSLRNLGAAAGNGGGGNGNGRDLAWPSWANGEELHDVPGAAYVMHPPGSELNPLVIRDQLFTDMVFELPPNVHLHFQNCRFERAPLKGLMALVTQKNCENVDVAPPTLNRVIRPLGTAQNRLVFYKQQLVRTTINLGSEVHALFEDTTFVACSRAHNGNADFVRCPEVAAPASERARPIVFYVTVPPASPGEPPTHIFGQVARELVRAEEPPRRVAAAVRRLSGALARLRHA